MSNSFSTCLWSTVRQSITLRSTTLQSTILRALAVLIFAGFVTELFSADERTKVDGEQVNVFEIARLHYSGGGDWYNDPSIIVNLCREINNRTDVSFPVASEREAVVSVSDVRLFQYPFLFMTGHGNVRVTDSGVGMTQSEVRKAFEPFYTTKGPNEGAGLGLAVSYRLVQQQGGSIKIDSVPGQGTTVTVSFRAADTKVGARVPPGAGESITAS